MVFANFCTASRPLGGWLVQTQIFGKCRCGLVSTPIGPVYGTTISRGSGGLATTLAGTSTAIRTLWVLAFVIANRPSDAPRTCVSSVGLDGPNSLSTAILERSAMGTAAVAISRPSVVATVTTFS